MNPLIGRRSTAYSLSLIITLPLGSGSLGPGVGVSVSLIAATVAKDGQPGGRESSRAALPVILGAARCAPQRERRPGARLLQCPARPRALRHGGGGHSQCYLTARFPKVCKLRWGILRHISTDRQQTGHRGKDGAKEGTD